MASCEKCWADSGGNPDLYAHYVNTRDCTPEEQAGPESEVCPECNRKTVHQYCHYCVICGTRPGVAAQENIEESQAQQPQHASE